MADEVSSIVIQVTIEIIFVIEIAIIVIVILIVTLIVIVTVAARPFVVINLYNCRIEKAYVKI